MEKKIFDCRFIPLTLLLLIGIGGTPLQGQYMVEGRFPAIASTHVAYLSILENWDDFDGISSEMIIKGVALDSTGYFRFSGDEISARLGFYRVHFAPKDQTAVTLYSYPENRRHINFLLTNQDSVFLDIGSGAYMLHHIKLRSSIPANKQVLDLSVKLDSLLFTRDHPQSEKHSDLMTQKIDGFVQNQMTSRADGLLNMFTLASSQLPYEGNEKWYNKVLRELDSPRYQKSYLQSLRNFVGAKDYGRLQQSSRRNTRLLTFSACLNVILIFLFVRYVKRQRDALMIKPKEALTSKETEVLNLIGAHKTNKEIAQALFVSEATIKTHINNIYRKTGVKSRKEALNYLKNQKSTPV